MMISVSSQTRLEMTEADSIEWKTSGTETNLFMNVKLFWKLHYLTESQGPLSSLSFKIRQKVLWSWISFSLFFADKTKQLDAQSKPGNWVGTVEKRFVVYGIAHKVICLSWWVGSVIFQSSQSNTRLFMATLLFSDHFNVKRAFALWIRNVKSEEKRWFMPRLRF